MIKQTIYILFFLTSFLISQSSVSSINKIDKSENVLTIIATANVKGEVDPCGWKKKPLGGLARKATILTEYNTNELNNTFVVDAGDLFFSENILEPGVSKEIAIVNANIILESFNKMGCTVFSPGSKDFAAGKDFIKNTYQNAFFPFVSSNIYDNETNKLLFEPYVIENRNGRRVAFIGLSSIFQSEGIDVKNPIPALDSILKEVTPISDIRILLFSSNDNDIKNIRKKYSDDIALIIRSHYKGRSFNGGADTPTYGVGEKGKILYKFDLNIQDSSMPFTDIAWCNKTIEDKTRRLDTMKKGNMLVDLKVLFKDNIQQLNKIVKFENQIEEANQKLENAINRLEFEKIELGKTVSGRIDILKIVDEGKLKIQEITRLNPDFKIKQKGHAHDHDGDGYPDH